MSKGLAAACVPHMADGGLVDDYLRGAAHLAMQMPGYKMVGALPGGSSVTNLISGLAKRQEPTPVAAAPIAPAAAAVQSASRAPDTMLAHVTPDEAQFIDYLQGGRRVNPNTGLPEYGMFGDILKAVARAAGAIGGFMVGGPLGAAAGAGAATKLTGGSWKDALTSAAMSGVGGELGQGLTGGGWNPLQAPTSGGIASASLKQLQNAAPNSIPLGNTFLGVAKSAPGLAAGAGALMGAPLNQPAAAPPAPQPGPGINLNVVPQPRTANTYPGNPLTFAQPGGWGQGFEFYTPMNPVPKYANAAPVDQQINPNLYFADGGEVSDDELSEARKTYKNLMANVYGPLQKRLQDEHDIGVKTGSHAGLSMAQAQSQFKTAQLLRNHLINKYGIYDLTDAEGGPVCKEPDGYRRGGRVRGYDMGGPAIDQGPTLGMRGIRGGGIAPPAMPQATTLVPAGGIGGIGHNDLNVRRAAMAGYMALRGGGNVRGPGDGKSDSIPALLSDGEHVIDSQTVSMLGNGSNEAGQKRLEEIKARIRARAGMKNPHKPSGKMPPVDKLLPRAS